MKLDEILDKPVDYKITMADDDKFTATFEINGNPIYFEAVNEDSHYGGDDSGEWMITFASKKLNGKPGLNFDLTKFGKEFTVFATLKAIIKEFFTKYSPNSVSFSADGGVRASVYSKLFAKNLPRGWELKQTKPRDADLYGDDTIIFDIVKEALDRPLPYEVTLNSSRGFHAEFVVGNRKIRFTADMMSIHPTLQTSKWEIAFAEVVKNKNGTEYEDLKKSGKGNEFEVFATVKKILQQFIVDKHPDEMTIDSSKSESNRAKLYQRMISKNLPTGWKMERDDSHPSYNTFVLSKE